MHKKHHQEALVTVDAYRVAFEEQLSRNKTFAKKMADVAIATTPVATKSLSMEERLDKAKAVLKFLIQTMTGGNLFPFPLITCMIWVTSQILFHPIDKFVSTLFSTTINSKSFYAYMSGVNKMNKIKLDH